MHYRTWLRKHGARYDGPQLVWRVSRLCQQTTMAEIRSQIIPSRGIRLTTDSIPGFPEVDIQAELFDIENSGQIDKYYEQMQDALQALNDKAAGDVDPEAAITKILRARQRVELLKVPAAIELAQDRLEQGFSVGFFVNFKQTLDEISRRMGCPYIDGSITGKKRDAVIAAYQANEIRALALNSEACGLSIGLQDLDGEHPRFGIVSPPWSATTFIQLVGRFPRDGGKSKSHFRVIFAAGTVETKMYSALKSKLDNLDALTDGDLQPENLVFEK